jgi:putative polyhydroxyalkanoate system protein
VRIAVPHNTTRDKARKIIEQKMKTLEGQYGHYANDVEHQWQGDTLHFAFKAKGIHGKGTVEITDSDMIIDGKLPLIAKPFESRIKSTVEREAEEMFRA